jgi:hypothetical protein
MHDNPLFHLMRAIRVQLVDPYQLTMTHLQPAAEYFDFLSIILGRYTLENETYLAFLTSQLAPHQSGMLTANELEELVMGGQLARQIQLDIESYYVFAKIMLDQLGLFHEDMFGLGQGCTLASHGKLTRNFARFCKQMDLAFADDLVSSQQHLEKTIGDYRDDRIEHQKSASYLKAMSFRIDPGEGPGTTTISHTKIGAKDGRLAFTTDGTERSSELSDLATAIDQYIVQVGEFITANRSKWRSSLMTRPG